MVSKPLVLKRDPKEFDQEYLSRHIKYKDENVINPEIDEEMVTTGDIDLLVSLFC